MSLQQIVFLTIFLTALIGVVIFVILQRIYQYYYNKEKHSFNAAEKIFGLLLQTSGSTETMQKIADYLPNELNFATGVIVLYEKDKNVLRRIVTSKTNQAIEAVNFINTGLNVPFTQIAVPIDDPNNIMSRSIREKKEFVTDKVYDVFTPVLNEQDSLRIQQILGTQSTFVYPLFVKEKPIGVIITSSKKKIKEITAYEKEIMRIFVSAAGIALQNALYLSSIQNISENLREANIQAGLAGKLKSDLLTMASHEFRTPTSNIKNMIWAFDKPEFINKLTDKERQYFDRLKVSADRLEYVVNNINQMLMATSGNLEETMNFSSIQIEYIIKQVLEDKEIESRDALVKLNYQEPSVLLPPIEADSTKIKYVIYELVTNALKYTGQNGTVSITTELRDHTITIKIIDSGKGIPSELLPNLFQGFDKIDPMHTTQSGMGLGLYLVNKIIKLHNGQLMVNSVVGKGTTFTIELPVQLLTNANSSPLNTNQPHHIA